MAEQNSDEINARFEELSVLEAEFDDAEAEIIRKTNALYAPLYKKRAAFIAKIPHFWALVLEQSPPEIDNFIQPSDSKVFSDALQTIEVSRFEIDVPNGSPRSFSIRFGFRENEYFENSVLEKKFWFRKSSDGWQGLVSEPVRIDWKKGKDLTDGLTDAAYQLYEAKKELTKSANGDAKSKESSLPEHKFLTAKMEESDASNSFFSWFGFVSSYKWVSAEESERAARLEAENLEKMRRGETVKDEEPDDDEQDFQETEVFPQGDELATIIAEDMWPSAIKYYRYAHEADDEEGLDEIEVEDLEDDSDNEIDIRGLVGKGQSKTPGDSPPHKKQRKS